MCQIQVIGEENQGCVAGQVIPAGLQRTPYKQAYNRILGGVERYFGWFAGVVPGGYDWNGSSWNTLSPCSAHGDPSQAVRQAGS